MAQRLTRLTIALAAAAGLLLLGTATSLPARAGSHAVEIADFAFSPPTLTIGVGETVAWSNSDPVVHTATSTSGAFDSGDLDPGESYSVTFTAPGIYEYLCTPHPTMTGTIIVEAAPAPASTAAPPLSGDDSLPDVAMPPPQGPSVIQLIGIGLVILSTLSALLIGSSRGMR